MTWALIIAISGAVAPISDVQIIPMATEAQCRASVDVMAPMKTVGVACVGPNGEVYEAKR